MIATRGARVAKHTSDDVNQRIQRKIRQSIEFHRDHPEWINQRLSELDREWDIERTLAMNSSALTAFGLLQAFLFGRRKWLLLSMIVQGFYIQHTLQGYCPPLPVLRRMGFRTTEEIEQERRGLVEARDGGSPAESEASQRNTADQTTATETRSRSQTRDRRPKRKAR